MDKPLDAMKSSAPALSRGLEIIRTLEDSAPLSLEIIANQLQIPKASALRLLETLDQMGIIRKGADKRYQALWKLSPVNSSLETFRTNLDPKMLQLVEATGCTVEWYEPTTDGMQLMLQKNPETELCVKARPGFLRDWQSEFEAIARLGHAFSERASIPSKSRHYTQNGVLEPINKKEIQRLIQEAKSKQSAYDSVYNSNGVRRFAVATFDSVSKRFIGVLATAETYHFARSANPKQMLRLLKSTLN